MQMMNRDISNMKYADAKMECDALAVRQLTDITRRQLTKEDAIQYMNEQLSKGSSAHLARVKEFQNLHAHN